MVPKPLRRVNHSDLAPLPLCPAIAQWSRAALGELLSLVGAFLVAALSTHAYVLPSVRRTASQNVRQVDQRRCHQPPAPGR